MFRKPFNGSFYCVSKDGVDAKISAHEKFPMKYFPYKINEIGEYASLSCLGGKPSNMGNKQATRGKEKSPETEESLEKLKRFYKTSNEKLFEMTGKVFPWS